MPCSRGSALIALLVIGLLEPLIFQVRNHPFQTVYFNQLAGGPNGALFRFELDYWGNSLIKAIEWSADLAERSSYPLLISGEPAALIRFDTRRYSAVSFVHDNRKLSHLRVELLRHSPDLTERLLRQPTIAHTIDTADGTPLCVITEGPRFSSVAKNLDLPHDRERRRPSDTVGS